MNVDEITRHTPYAIQTIKEKSEKKPDYYDERPFKSIERFPFMVFDCETNGMIKDYSLPADVVDNFPRISQLSWNCYNSKQELVKSVNHFVKPDNWVFPDEQFFREHADINKNIEFGKPIKEVLEEYIWDRLNSDYCVAHNMSFDSKVIRAEMIRLNMKIEFKAKKICTMTKSTSYCKLPKPSGKGLKWPKLEELYRILFKSEFENAHDSLGDINATAKCLFELIRLKVIVLE